MGEGKVRTAKLGSGKTNKLGESQQSGRSQWCSEVKGREHTTYLCILRLVESMGSDVGDGGTNSNVAK